MSESLQLGEPGGRRDWLIGQPAIVYSQCAVCTHIWYLPQATCPHCGTSEILMLQSNGKGVVHACTLVHRAPTADFKEIAPYLLIFVDAAEGFRIMAHGTPNLKIGDAVEAGFVSRAGRLVPVFRQQIS